MNLFPHAGFSMLRKCPLLFRTGLPFFLQVSLSCYNVSTPDPVLCFSQFPFPTPRLYSLLFSGSNSRPAHPRTDLHFQKLRPLDSFTLSIYSDLCSSLVVIALTSAPLCSTTSQLFAFEWQAGPFLNASPRPPPQATEKGNMRTSELGAVRVLKFIGWVRSRLRLFL